MKQVDTGEIIELVSNSSKTLWILCGLPYSGKSFLAKKIMEKIGIEFVSIDDILSEKGYDWNINKLPDASGWQEVFDISYAKARKALVLGKNVLYDSTNHTKVSRDTLREVAKSVDGEAKIIFINTPESVVLNRWEKNKETKERFVLDENLLNMTIKSLEIPETEDGYQVIL